MKKIYKCTECGKPFTLDDCELPKPRTVNDGTKTERIVCDSCFESAHAPVPFFGIRGRAPSQPHG